MKRAPDAAIAFIGGGNMARALIGGMLDTAAPPAIVVSEPDAARRDALAARFGAVRVTAANVEAAGSADIVILATKPDVLPGVCQALRADGLTAERAFVSIAAGVRLARLRTWLGPTAGLVRAMPNQPALVGRGLTTLTAGDDTPQTLRSHVQQLFAAAGDVLWLADEAQMNASTALSGSGPAYFYRLMEILADNARHAGFDAAEARRIAVATALGAATMAAESDEALATLRESVTSPGGTTAAALAVLADADIHAIFSGAIEAAIDRGEELDAAADD